MIYPEKNQHLVGYSIKPEYLSSIMNVLNDFRKLKKSGEDFKISFFEAKNTDGQDYMVLLLASHKRNTIENIIKKIPEEYLEPFNPNKHIIPKEVALDIFTYLEAGSCLEEALQTTGFNPYAYLTRLRKKELKID